MSEEHTARAPRQRSVNRNMALTLILLFTVAPLTVLAMGNPEFAELGLQLTDGSGSITLAQLLPIAWIIVVGQAGITTAKAWGVAKHE